MTPRYYAQYIGANTVFEWEVFDRQITDRKGEALPICLCLNREQAFKIRDALNVTLKK